MKGRFVDFVRGLRDPVRARRQEKIREVELTWSDHDLSNFRVFALGLPSAEMADVCYALADATAIPLLELLVDYAEVNNDLLRIAFGSLDKAPLSARLFLANRLFASGQAVVRAAACDMLAEVGPSAAGLLSGALEDESSLVEAAAIRALVKINHVEASGKILARLRGDNEELRSLALGAMIRLGAHAPAFEVEALGIFRNPDESLALRRQAAKALSALGSGDGRLVMLEILEDKAADIELRKVAAETLGGFADAEAISALLRTMCGGDAGLSETARQSVSRMNPRDTLNILRERIQGGDEAQAIIAAGLLGGMSVPEAGMALADCLEREKRPVVVAALADSLGKSGFPGAWKALFRKLRRDSPDSIPLLAALADATDEDNLDEFAMLLDELPETGAGEIVLRRLATFGRSVKPSPAIRRRAVDVLDSGNRALAIPAIEILAYSGEDGVRDRLLTEMASIGPELPTRRLLRVMLRFKGGELAALFENVGMVAAPLLADAAAEADRVGKGAVEFFAEIASWVRREAAGAREGLFAAARVDPANLMLAMRDSPDRVFLLEAWTRLSERDRLLQFPDLDGLFAACDAKDRLLALGFLSALDEERHLRPVAMLAFTDRDPNVKAAAISLVRRMAGMDS